MGTNKYIEKEYAVAQLAYLAGIIDGEGSIYIGNFSKNPKTGAKYYQTNIEVTNCDINLMNWLTQTFGGRVYKYSEKQKPKNNRQDYYRWIVTGNCLTHLCKILLPYFIIKKRQCEIMIKMRATYTGTGNGPAFHGKQGIQPNSQETLDLRQKLMDEMQSLHIRNYSNKK